VCGCLGWVLFHAHKGTLSGWRARLRAWRRRAAAAAWERLFPPTSPVPPADIPPVPPADLRRDTALYLVGGQDTPIDDRYEVILVMEDLLEAPVPPGAIPLAPNQEPAVLQVGAMPLAPNQEPAVLQVGAMPLVTNQEPAVLQVGNPVVVGSRRSRRPRVPPPSLPPRRNPFRNSRIPRPQ
jgi:hypothetical protein